MARFIGKTDDGKDIYGLDFDLSVKSVSKEKDGRRIFSMIGSTPNIDRDGDTISQKGWVTKHFKKSPVVQWAHDHKIPAIAKVNKFSVEDAALNFDEIEFPKEGIHPFADLIASLMEDGFLKAGSVGFLPIKSEKREMTDKEKDSEPNYLCPPANFIKQELLEFSICNVGSNRDALITHLGQKGFKTSGKVEIDGHEFEMKQLIDALFVEDDVMKTKEEKRVIPYPTNEFFEGVAFPEVPDLENESNCTNCDIKMDEEKSIEITKDQAEKPFTNEHACRLESPSQFDSFRRQNNAVQHDGKRIDFIFGIKEGKSKLQAMRYPKSIWTSASAKSHCASKDGSFEAASKYCEITRDAESGELTLKINESFKDFHDKNVRIDWKSVSTERCFEANLQSYDDDKGKWFNVEILNIIDIEEKAGAVLSKSNKNKLKQAESLIGEVLADSEPAEVAPENETETNPKLPENIELKEILSRIGNMEKAIDALAIKPEDVPEHKTDELSEEEFESDESPVKKEGEIDFDNLEIEEKDEEIDMDMLGQALGKMIGNTVKGELRKVTGKID